MESEKLFFSFCELLGGLLYVFEGVWKFLIFVFGGFRVFRKASDRCLDAFGGFCVFFAVF